MSERSASAAAAGAATPASTMDAVAPPSRRFSSRWWQLAIVAAAAAFVVLALTVAPKLVKPVAEQSSEATRPVPGTFKPTKEQWQGSRSSRFGSSAFVPSK